MATAQRVDPFKNFKFLVEIDKIVQGGFLECSGFGSAVEVIEYREGGEASTVRKLPGKVSYPDINLKWGVTDSRVQSNEAYLVVILLSRVVTRLGSVSQVTPKVIEGLFAADLAFLQQFYNRINHNGKPELDAVCPKCSQQFAVETQGAGGL